MLERVLEPEVMDTLAEARDYDSMDHGEVNRRFVDDLLSFCSTNHWWSTGDQPEVDRQTWLLDVGTGTGLIPIELVGRSQEWSVLGIDLAESMLELGRTHIDAGGWNERIRLELVDAKQMPYRDESFAGVISNSIVHHIPEPSALFGEMRRVLAPGGVFFVRDLLRPDSMDDLNSLVSKYAGDATPNQRQLFRQSLLAALTLEEVRNLVRDVDLAPETVQQTSDRHWTLAARI